MSEFKNIQWFPGHMAKTRRELKELLKNVDLVAEILDSRIPLSSSNPELGQIIESKPRVIVLNKTDLSDDFQNKAWIKFYEEQGFVCTPLSLKDSKSGILFINTAMQKMKSKIDLWKSKGINGRSIRIMAVGIPNVGKSSFINKLCKNSKAKVENHPGVTRKAQWFSVGKSIELLDTPGVLWPKFDDETTAYNLAFTGAIKDEILDAEDLAVNLIKKIKIRYTANLCKRFNLDPAEAQMLSCTDLLKYIGKKRGMLIAGGEIDVLRTSIMILEEFRSGKLGKITLEYPKNKV